MGIAVGEKTSEESINKTNSFMISKSGGARMMKRLIL
jgi:hypothetical protein